MQSGNFASSSSTTVCGGVFVLGSFGLEVAYERAMLSGGAGMVPATGIASEDEPFGVGDPSGRNDRKNARHSVDLCKSSLVYENGQHKDEV